MHPIEHLRHLARADGASGALVAAEAASALADMARMDTAGLVPACRRLIEAHLVSGPVWSLCARVLAADDPEEAAYQCAHELGTDRTARHLVAELPEGATVVVMGWPDLAGDALRSRGDVEALVVDAGQEGSRLVRRIRDADGGAALVEEGGVGSAAYAADLVLVEARAAGPSGLLAAPGSLAAAAVGAQFGKTVWAVLGAGSVLPDRLWAALLSRFDETGDEPWDREAELVPAELLTAAINPQGLVEVDVALAQASCPVAPELLRPAG
jgi:hypothetical protein